VACWFIEKTRLQAPTNKLNNPIFKIATHIDSDLILKETGDFFDRLDTRINDKTIFILEENEEILGCGNIERGRYFKSNVSIGMVCLKQHRQKGVASTILWHLKALVYKRGKTADCGMLVLSYLISKIARESGVDCCFKEVYCDSFRKRNPTNKNRKSTRRNGLRNSNAIFGQSNHRLSFFSG